MRYYNGVLPDVEPDRRFAVVDGAWGGGDFTAAAIVYQYGEDLFVPDVVYNNGDKTVTQPLIVGAILRHELSAVKIEATKTTPSYREDIDKTLRDQVYRINMQLNTTHWTVQGKRDRIIAASPDIRSRMVFLQEGLRSKEYSQFMQNMYSFTFVMRKNQHDDASDVCSQVIDFAFHGISKAVAMRSPFSR
jgi:predicted phage terminase large subunit-like protein